MQTRLTVRLFGLALPLAISAGSTDCVLAETHAGAVVYVSKCQSCHGAKGEGVEDAYDEPLIGDQSIDELTLVIARTMPEKKPEACVGEEARAVAEYIYHEFYSRAARQRKGNANPRVELSRLTVPQFRNAIADIIGHFTPAPQDNPSGRRGRRSRNRAEPTSPAIPKSSPGLRAEYFQSKGMSKANNLHLERVDYSIDFDFKNGSPHEKITPDQFAIVWQGSFIANDTGFHEFRVRTQNGARLYLNNDAPERRSRLRDDSSVAGQAALIDAWVSSGTMREHKARVFLLGGRQYPLRLEFFKYLEKTASIRLEWKPPHGIWTVLDRRHLTTDRSPRTFVVDTPFPADDRSLGYERGSSVSRAWHTAATSAAVATASEVINRLPLLAKTDEKSDDRIEELKEFLTQFATVAFRRPLSEDEKRFLQEVPFSQAPNTEAAVRRAILLVLKSPHFLYTDLTGPGQAPTQYTITARLSFALWDSIPDRELFTAANNGQLQTLAQIESQAQRMIDKQLSKNKMRAFFQHWLELEDRDLTKDKSIFPDFDEAIITELRKSLELFVEQVVWSEKSDYRQLLLADYLVLNDGLREWYRSELRVESAADADDDFQKVAFQADRRAGVLTHPYLLSAFAYAHNSSPIHRGVFLTRNIVGRDLKPPPIAVAFKDEEFAPDLTMREKITQLTRDKACMSCHSVINPLGFALENYDAIGRWRTVENDQWVDAKSTYTTSDGRKVDVQNARDVANFAVESEQAHRAFLAQLFNQLVKQNPAAYGPDALNRLRSEFENDDFNIKNAIIRIAVLSASHGINSPPIPESES